MNPAKPLTDRQIQVLEALADFWREGRSPTTSELMQRLRLQTISGLDDMLGRLQTKGFLLIEQPGKGKQRRFELTVQGKAITGLGIPVLGSIPAGPLQEAIQQNDEWVEDAGSLLRHKPGDFLLRVSGDSMLHAGILPHDLVLLRPGVEPRNGEIVAAQITDEVSGSVEATLKHLDYLEGKKKVRLRAANPAYPDREFPARNVSVAGVFRGLVRDSSH
ncbi:LexA family transcriptional regulator [bacterium]|nr:MAG: LexA family transcriptional regulator [bacterium]